MTFRAMSFCPLECVTELIEFLWPMMAAMCIFFLGDSFQMVWVDASPMEARNSTLAGLRLMANMVKLQSLWDFALRQFVTDDVSTSASAFVPHHRISASVERAGPFPASIRQYSKLRPHPLPNIHLRHVEIIPSLRYTTEDFSSSETMRGCAEPQPGAPQSTRRPRCTPARGHQQPRRFQECTGRRWLVWFRGRRQTRTLSELCQR